MRRLIRVRELAVSFSLHAGDACGLCGRDNALMPGQQPRHWWAAVIARPRSANTYAVDSALAAVVAVPVSVQFANASPGGATPLGVLLNAGTVLPLIWRRRAPFAVAVTVAAFSLLASVYNRPGQDLPYGALLATYTVADLGRRWQRWGFLGGLVLILGPGALLRQPTFSSRRAPWTRLGKLNPAAAAAAVALLVSVVSVLLWFTGRRAATYVLSGVGLAAALGAFLAVRAWVPEQRPGVVNNRRGETFWSVPAARPAAVIRMPVTFPPEVFAGGRLLSGLGVPDISGRIGKPAFYTSDPFYTVREGNDFSIDLVRLPSNVGRIETKIRDLRASPSVSRARSSCRSTSRSRPRGIA